jgi:hypothetical protein
MWTYDITLVELLSVVGTLIYMVLYPLPGVDCGNSWEYGPAR